MENIYEFGDQELDPPLSDGTFGDISLKENCSGHKQISVRVRLRSKASSLAEATEALCWVYSSQQLTIAAIEQSEKMKPSES